MSISNHPVEQEELMAYLDGELASNHAAETAEHLDQCPHCRQLADNLREVSAVLVSWQVEEAEREPAKNVLDELQKRAAQKPPFPVTGAWRGPINPLRWPKPVWGLAGAALVLIAIWTSMSFRKSPAPRSFDRLETFSKLSRAPDEPRNSKAQKASIQNGQVTSSKDNIGTLGSLAAPSIAADSNGLFHGLGDKATNSFSVDGQPTVDGQGKPIVNGQPAQDVFPNGSMIIHTAELQLTTEAFEKARAAVEEIVKRHRGYVGEMNVNTPAGSARSLTGRLFVPADQLEATLADLKGLGRTQRESQGGQEVTREYVDLEARLANSKHTEQRLTEMLQDRTGKLSDVLAVEMQISRVRGEIEQMEAQRKTMKNQVDFATLNLALTEDYKKELNVAPPSTGTQFRNAAIDGYRSLVEGIIAVLLWLLSTGPALLLWIAIVFFPARMAWRKLKPRLAKV